MEPHICYSNERVHTLAPLQELSKSFTVLQDLNTVNRGQGFLSPLHRRSIAIGPVCVTSTIPLSLEEACLFAAFLKTFGFLVGLFCSRVASSNYILYLFHLSKRKGTHPVANPIRSTFKIHPDSGHLHLPLSYYCSLSHPLPRNQQSSFVSFLFSYCLITLKAPRSSQSDVCRKKARSCHLPAIGPSTASVVESDRSLQELPDS